MKGFAYLISLWLFLSCGRGADPLSTLQGTYTGTFQRDNGNTSQVELSFSGNRYSGRIIGASSSTTIPVICRGQFELSQQAIDFRDECYYTANFDWTLILSHTWVISANTNRLILSRGKDQYVLARQ